MVPNNVNKVDIVSVCGYCGCMIQWKCLFTNCHWPFTSYKFTSHNIYYSYYCWCRCVNGRTGSGPVRSTSCETPHNAFKIASWNIGTMRGRSSEIVETITRRNIDLCCVQEVRWRGASARHITGKDSRYKFFWIGNNQGTSGVGVLLAEKWVDKVYDIKRVSDRIMLFKLLVGRLSTRYCLSMPLQQDWRSPQRMHSTTACKLSSQNYQIKK